MIICWMSDSPDADCVRPEKVYLSSEKDACEPAADESHKPQTDDTERLFADEDPTPYECVDGPNIKCEDVLTEPEAWEMRVKKGAPREDKARVGTKPPSRAAARVATFEPVPSDVMETGDGRAPGLGAPGWGDGARDEL